VSSIMFLEQLEGLRNRYLGRLRLLHVLSDEPQEIELLSGLLDQPRCASLLATVLSDAPIDEAFICGPAPMMDAAEAALLAFGVARERIRIERFGTPPGSVSGSGTGIASGPGHSKRHREDQAGDVAGGVAPARIVIVVDGKERHLELAHEGVSLLDAGLAAGAPLPYACKGGVCCTCRCKVLEGEVRMDRNFTLEPQEIEAGFVLSCQAHPVTDRVVVSFDER